MTAKRTKHSFALGPQRRKTGGYGVNRTAQGCCRCPEFPFCISIWSIFVTSALSSSFCRRDQIVTFFSLFISEWRHSNTNDQLEHEEKVLVTPGFVTLSHVLELALLIRWMKLVLVQSHWSRWLVDWLFPPFFLMIHCILRVLHSFFWIHIQISNCLRSGKFQKTVNLFFTYNVVKTEEA